MNYSTDFFLHQERAKKSSTLLVIYFIAGLVLIITAIYGAVLFGLAVNNFELNLMYSFFDPLLFLAVSVLVTSIIGGATLHQLSKYSKGGGALVAQMLGGRSISFSTYDPKERMLVNVVEEMAIASGVPVPSIYMLEENGINAFAAGYSTDNAVIAVTKGAMETLTRDELQGVIAHEFSHILNGDMRLNLRLTGVLYGLYVLAIIGWTLLRVLGRSGSRRRSSSKKGGGGAIIIVALIAGISFLVFGFIGEFVGRLIQRAISRQREFLADASAVQFTRNPQGIAGALKKIGGYTDQSYIRSKHAKEMSHMFFAEGLRSGLSSLFSTHPDLITRIKRIDPYFNGTFPPVRPISPTKKTEGVQRLSTISEPVYGAETERQRMDQEEIEETQTAVLNSIGTVTPEHVSYAAGLLETIPQELVAASRDSYSARSIIYTLLINEDMNVCNVQLESLASRLTAHEFSELKRILCFKSNILPQHRLALVDLALPSLGQMSQAQYLNFIKNINVLIEADNRIDAFEFVVRQFIKNQYNRISGNSLPQSNRSASRMVPEVKTLLSTLARQGAEGDQIKAQEAFRKGMIRFESSSGLRFGTYPMPPQDSLTFLNLDKAVDLLSQANYKSKQWIMEACTQCVLSDVKVTIKEFELVRAVGEVLGIPIPPHIEVS